MFECALRCVNPASLFHLASESDFAHLGDGPLFKETLYRISRAEDALEESRRETLELAEAKAALERELNTLRMQAVEGLDGTAIAG